MAVVYVALVARLGASPVDYRPYWSDETKNWNAIQAVADVGLATGYYSIQEIEPILPVSRFGPHGPALPLSYGFAARLMGWSISAAGLYNAAIVGMAILGFFMLCKGATLTQLLVLCGFLISYWPIILLTPAVMQESVHLALALLVAPMAYRGMFEANGRYLAGAAALTAVAALFRPTWGFVLFPLVLQLFGQRRRLGIIAATVSALLPWVIYRLLVPAHPSAGSSHLTSYLFSDPWSFAGLIVANVEKSAMVFFSGIQNAGQLSLAQPRILAALLLAGILVLLMKGTRRGAGADRKALWFALWALGPLLGLSAVLANIGDGRDYRVLAAPVLLVVLLLGQNFRWVLVAAAALLLNIGVSAAFGSHFQAARGPNFIAEDLTALRQELAAVLQYRPHPNGWCNTLYAENLAPGVKRRLYLTLPPGIGLSVKLRDLPTLKSLKSGYYLTGQPEPATPTRKHLALVQRTTIGNLYRNGLAGCGPENR